MIDDKKSAHVVDLAGDYTLDLLSHERRQQVIAHLALCNDCRHAVLNERKIHRLVRETITSTTSLNDLKLDKYMPDLSTLNRRSKFAGNWQVQIALVFALMFVVLAGLTIEVSRRNAIWPVVSPTTTATEGAGTETPTATMAVTEVKVEAISLSIPTPVANYAKLLNGPPIVPVQAAAPFR